jgi:hypothetical protein
MVEHLQQRHPVFVVALHQFQVSDCEPVEPDIIIRLQPAERGNMRYPRIFSSGEIVKRCAGRDLCQLEIFQTEAFERGRLEVVQQFFAGEVGGKNPVFERIGVKSVAVHPCELPETPFGQYNFGRFETLEQLVHRGRVAFRGKEFAGGYIEECQSVPLIFAVGYRGEVIVVVVFEERVVGSYAGCNHLRDGSSDYLSRHRFFHLFANGHAVARAHEAREIRFECMEGETGQFDIGATVIAAGECDTECSA